MTHDSSAALCQVHLQCQGSAYGNLESQHKFLDVSLGALAAVHAGRCSLGGVHLHIKKEGWLHFIQIGFSLLPPGSSLVPSRSVPRATEVLPVPCVSKEAGAQLFHSKSCLIPH